MSGGRRVSGCREWGAAAACGWNLRPATDRSLSLSLTRSLDAPEVAIDTNHPYAEFATLVVDGQTRISRIVGTKQVKGS